MRLRQIKNLSLQYMPGQENSCGATLLDAMRVLSMRTSYADPFYGRSVRLTYSADTKSAFLVALKSPFSLIFSAAIPPSAALCESGNKTYSLFLNGLPQYSTCEI